jgi:glycosyltransferase involved in cell wall biosynthesis
MKRTKRILFVNQSSGYLMYDLVNSEVFDSFEKVFFKGTSSNKQKELIGNVKIINTISYRNDNIFWRFLTWFISSVHLWILIALKYRKSHIFLTSNPPISHFIAAVLKLDFSVLVLDVYPDVLTRSGVLNNDHFLVSQFKKLNSKIYSKARRIYTLSEGMKKVLGNYLDESNIQVIPLWGDDDNLIKIEKNDNEFLKKFGLQDKFILLYSGNMGLTHPVEILEKIAAKIENTAIHILAIGGGPKYKPLNDFARKNHSKNITVLPWQDRHLLSEIISAADLGVVTSDSRIADISVPSKLFNLLQLNIPILAVGHEDSELNYIVNKFELGMCFNERQLDLIVDYILKCYGDKEFLNYLMYNTKIALPFFSKTNLLNIDIN